MDEPRSVILTGLRAEAATIEPFLGNRHTHVVAGKQFVLGTLADRAVALTWTGIGKVNAAMITTLAVQAFTPRMLIGTGVAGALHPELTVGDVIVGAQVGHADFGELTPDGHATWAPWNPLTFTPHPPMFPADANLLTQALTTTPLSDVLTNAVGDQPPSVVAGTIVTGDVLVPFVTDRQRIRAQFTADACDMESVAMAQVCWTFSIPYLTIRGISDTANDAKVQMTQYLHVAVGNALHVIRRVFQPGSSDATASEQVTAADASERGQNAW